ncbi:MAG: hypothetical protein EOO65_03635, partial [Methanosarcinales archaeon]
MLPGEPAAVGVGVGAGPGTGANAGAGMGPATGACSVATNGAAAHEACATFFVFFLGRLCSLPNPDVTLADFAAAGAGEGDADGGTLATLTFEVVGAGIGG